MSSDAKDSSDSDTSLPTASEAVSSPELPDAPPAPIEPGPRVSAAVLHAYLNRPATQVHLRNVVAGALGKRATRTLVDDLANNASMAAITATEQAESEEKLAAWLDGVARITVKVHFGELKADKDLLQRFADAGGPVVLYAAADDEKWLVGKWLKEKVADTPHEKEVYEVIVAKAKSKKTYEQLAEERGIPIRSISSRIARLKEKYRPLWLQHRRDRNRFILFRLAPGVAAAVLVIGAILWALFWPRPAPVPAVKEPLPVPSASASAPPPEPFMPAQPRKAPSPKTIDPDGKR